MPYTVVDRDGRTAESAITVIVDYPLNNPPAANPDTFTIFREEMLNVLANDTDIEGGALETVSVSQPASGGSVEKVGQQVRVTPTAGTGCIIYLHVHRP